MIKCYASTKQDDSAESDQRRMVKILEAKVGANEYSLIDGYYCYCCAPVLPAYLVLLVRWICSLLSLLLVTFSG